MLVDEVTVYSSQLDREGPTYEVLGRAPPKAGGSGAAKLDRIIAAFETSDSHEVAEARRDSDASFGETRLREAVVNSWQYPSSAGK